MLNIDLIRKALILWLCFLPLFVVAQSPTTLQLLLPQTGEPLTFAHFRYGEQQGNSGPEGRISLVFQAETELVVSHVQLGQQRFSSEVVAQALQTGKLTLPEQPLALMPVTVMDLRPTPNGTMVEPKRFSAQDRLAHDAGAVLNQLPVLSSIRKSGSYGFDPVLRGFKYDQLNLVIDGAQSATAACPNRMDPPSSQISLNMMERVEVMKGPYSLRYGNSFGGTINFITPAPIFTETLTPTGRISSSWESNGGIFRTEGNIGFQTSKLEAIFSGAWSEGGNYTDGDGMEIPSSFSRGSFGAKIAGKLAPNQLLTLSATRNLARDVDFAALPMDLRTDDTWLLNLRHEANFTNAGNLAAWTTTAYATFVDHLMDNLSKPLNPRMVNASTAATTRTFGGRTEATLLTGNGQLFVGGDLRVEEAEGTRTREFLMGPNAGNTAFDNAWQESRISRSAAFAEYQLFANSWQFTFSGRLELNQAQSSDTDERFGNLYGTEQINQVNPSVSIGATKPLSEHWVMGLWVGRAQRSGSLTERYINFFPVGQDPYELVGNPSLNPEVNHQTDLSLQFEKGNFSLKANVFAAYLTDFIGSEIREDLQPRLPMSPGVRQFVNFSEALLTGTEISLQHKLGGGWQQQLHMAYTYGEDLANNRPLAEISPLDLRYQLSGQLLNGKLQPSAQLRQVFTQNRDAEYIGETATPAFTLIDIMVQYRATDALQFSTGVQNLFDVAYYEHLNRSVRAASQRPIFAPGRNFHFTAGYRF